MDSLFCDNIGKYNVSHNFPLFFLYKVLKYEQATIENAKDFYLKRFRYLKSVSKDKRI